MCDRVWERKGVSCAQALCTFHPSVHCEQSSLLALPSLAVSVQILAKKEQETPK